MLFQNCLKGYKLKSWLLSKKRLNWLNRLNRMNSNRSTVRKMQKISLSPSGLLFLVKVEPQPVEVRSRFG